MNHSDTYDPRWSSVGAALAAQAVPANATNEGQYSLRKILSIWAAAAIPMAILGWLLPLLIGGVDLGVGEANNLAFTRAGLLTLGLIWQFVLVLFIVYRDEGSLSMATIRKRSSTPWLVSST